MGKNIPAQEVKIYNKALNKWGVEAQIGMTIEEIGELLVAINKIHRNNIHERWLNLAEEIADVELMLGQLKYIFDCSNVVADIRKKKLWRLESRLNEK